jgi:hypothetical protein
MTPRSGDFRIPVAILVLPLVFAGLAEANRCSFLIPISLSAPAILPIEPAHAAMPAPNEQHLTAQSFLAEKLWLWQERLNLTSWNIRLTMIRASELRPKTLGNIHWDANTHTAEIHVLASEDYKLSTRDMLADMEITVVHELVHLQLSSLPRSEASRGAEEYAVNQITHALLKLDAARR